MRFFNSYFRFDTMTSTNNIHGRTCGVREVLLCVPDPTKPTGDR